MDRAIARSIRQGRGLRFPNKDQTFEFNKLFIIWLFALSLQARNWPVGITGEKCASQSECAFYRLQT